MPMDLDRDDLLVIAEPQPALLRPGSHPLQEHISGFWSGQDLSTGTTIAQGRVSVVIQSLTTCKDQKVGPAGARAWAIRIEEGELGEKIDSRIRESSFPRVPSTFVSTRTD